MLKRKQQVEEKAVAATELKNGGKLRKKIYLGTLSFIESLVRIKIYILSYNKH